MSFPYQIAIGPASSSTPSQVVTVFREWDLNKNLDDGCSLSMTLPGNSLPGVLMQELQTDIWIYLQGVLVERMRIVSIEHTWNADGADDLLMTAVCYRRLLASRHVITPLSYTADSLGAIAWELITHTQSQTNGNLGITFGADTTTAIVDRDYTVGSNILELITNLATAETGMAWEIDANLVFYSRDASDFPNRPQPAELGNNLLSLAKPSGASSFANVVIATGDTRQTTPYITNSVGLPTDARGRWERYASFPSEGLQSGVDEQGRGLLRDTLSPQIEYRFSVDQSRFLTDTRYELGDFITVVEPPGYVPSTANPTIPIVLIPGTRVSAQVIAQSIRVTADGDLDISMVAIRAAQRWVDVATGLIWDDVDPALSWDNLDTTYLTL